MIIVLSLFKLSMAFHSDLLILSFIAFLFICSIGKCLTVFIKLSNFTFLPLGGVKLLLFATIDSSSFSESRKNSANLNLRQNASVSFVISSKFLIRGVGVNFSPFSSILISLCVSGLFDKFIIFGSIFSCSLFFVILCGLVQGCIRKKNS